MSKYPHSIIKIVFITIMIFLTLSGCSIAKTPNANHFKHKNLLHRKKSSTFVETGKASYYGNSLNGHNTASGEIFNNKLFIAAHRTLPFGTLVKVTSLTNYKTVTVRIVDRGPFRKGRIIDLSQAAASKIDLISKGLDKVKLEVISSNK